VDLMRDDMVPVETLWGRSGGCLRERLLEALRPEDALSVMEESHFPWYSSSCSVIGLYF